MEPVSTGRQGGGGEEGGCKDSLLLEEAAMESTSLEERSL